MTDEEETIPQLPSVSVVIPARDIAPWLPAQLEALSAQTYQGPLEIVVVLDESSTDGTIELARGVGALASAVQRPSWLLPAEGSVRRAISEHCTVPAL